MVWEGQYLANELPEDATPAWSRLLVQGALPEGTIVEISPAGFLHTKSISGVTKSIKWQLARGEGFGDAVTVEFRMKVISGDVTTDETYSFYLSTQTDAYYTDVYIYEDALLFWLDGDPTTIPFDTTNKYHTYRLTIDGDGLFKAYADNKLIHQESAAAGTVNPLVDYSPFTGAASVSEHSLDYIYYAKGAFEPKPLVGRKYPFISFKR